MKTKRNLLLMTVLSSLVIVIYSCHKTITTETNQNSAPVNFINNARLSDKFTNPDDPEDTKMNGNLLMIAKAFTKIAQIPDLMTIVYNQAALSSNGEVKYSVLISLDSRFKSILNCELGVICPPPLGTMPDPYKCIDDSMIYQGVDYYPNIFIPNLNTAIRNQLPYICVGSEIDEDDHILAFNVHANGTVTETNIGQPQAETTSTPIVIFNNGTDHIEEVEDETIFYSAPGIGNPSTLGGEDWRWDQIQINNGYRYEHIGKSDVECYLSFHDINGNLKTSTGSFVGGNEVSLIRKIKAVDISNSHLFTGVNSQVFPDATTVSASDFSTYPYAYITTYEYDWWASHKIVSSCGNLNSQGFYHDPKMKYSSEWYSNTICQTTVHSTWLYYVNGLFGFGNFKGFAVIKRIQ
jgi:hypothetical protein